MKEVAITFDVDYTDYLSNSVLSDEMEECWGYFQEFVKAVPQLKTSWFIRIDNQIKELHGAEDYIFQKHFDKISWLRNNGHEMGWHFHSYIKEGEKWVQNSDESKVVEEMKKQIPFITKHDLKVMRMGWAYHGNLSMNLVDKMGFLLDCTALPRPNYPWENGCRDWSTSSKEIYYPSSSDYRIGGTDSLDILEVPITVLPIEGPFDTIEGVERYINPAYKTEIFEKVLRHTLLPQTFNTVTHPYEFINAKVDHAMLSFSSSSFLRNLELLKQQEYTFVTMSDYVKNKKRRSK